MKAPGDVAPLLLGLDFSPPGDAAFAVAVDLARRLGAPLVLVHAFTDQPRAAVHGSFTGQKVVQTLQRLGDEAATRRLTREWGERARQAGLQVTTVAREGPPEEAVVEEAQRHDARIVVVGTVGWGGLRRLLLGSVAAAVVKRSPVPVLVVPYRSH